MPAPMAAAPASPILLHPASDVNVGGTREQAQHHTTRDEYTAMRPALTLQGQLGQVGQVPHRPPHHAPVHVITVRVRVQVRLEVQLGGIAPLA